MTVIKVPWWKDATIYQIYPASFKDSNGDGIGDIPGIISELDHIQGLGVDVIWVCPMYASPQVDMGYDISDYESVHAPYGTLQDMETLISDCHKRNMRIILDLVINHTSDQHCWFQESKSSKTNPKRNWYIWRPARYDFLGNRHPPNNWRSHFGGSVWEWDELTQEYYLHLFCPEQPDLNWENPDTRQAIYQSAMHFWLLKGVDGFRVDTVNMYSKPASFPDAPITDPTSEYQFAANLFCNGPRLSKYLREMNNVLEGYGAMTVGELPHTPEMKNVLKYVSAKEKMLSMVFQFDIVDVGMGKTSKYHTIPRNWKLPELKNAFKRTQALLRGTDAWTTVFVENHDQARSISRFGCDSTPEFWEKSGKMLSVLLATMSGTLFLYQGQEIGMVNAPAEWPMTEYKDVETANYLAEIATRTNNDPTAMMRAELSLQHLARDHSRTPMQWNSSKPHAGFSPPSSKTLPWMRVHDNYSRLNVQAQSSDNQSLLNFWKRMLYIRKEHADIFIHGDFDLQEYGKDFVTRDLNGETPSKTQIDESIFAFRKTAKSGRSALVVLNFGEKTQPFWTIPGDRYVGNYQKAAKDVLRPYEAAIYIF